MQSVEESPKANIHVDLRREAHKNTKMENFRPRWHTWILVLKVHFNPWQTSNWNKLMIIRKTYLNRWLKDPDSPPQKKPLPNNYRPITSLLMMWKILTTKIREEISYSLTSRGEFPDKHKVYRKGSRDIGKPRYTDLHILKVSKTKLKNLVMAQIDHKKAYDMVPHSWIIHCL